MPTGDGTSSLHVARRVVIRAKRLLPLLLLDWRRAARVEAGLPLESGLSSPPEACASVSLVLPFDPFTAPRPRGDGLKVVALDGEPGSNWVAELSRLSSARGEGKSPTASVQLFRREPPSELRRPDVCGEPSPSVVMDARRRLPSVCVARRPKESLMLAWRAARLAREAPLPVGELSPAA